MRMTRTCLTIAIASVASLSLSACISLGGGDPPDSLFTLTTAAQPAPATSVRSGTVGSALIILAPTVPQKLRTARIPVQSSDTTIAYLVDAQWVEPPSRLFQRLLTETIGAGGDRVVLSENELVTGPGELLSGELVDFGVDARTSEVVVAYQAARLQQDGTLIIQRRFEARQRISEVTPALVSEALNRAANDVAGQVALWVGN